MTSDQENNITEITKNEVEEKKPKLSKKKKYILFGLIGLFILIGIYFFIHSITYVSTDDAYIEGNLIPISPKLSGTIEKVYIDDNQFVKKGDLIATIDPKDYEVQLEQALARLEGAIEKQNSANININFTSITSQANEQQANSNVNVAKTSIEIANKQILQAKANLEQANQQVKSAEANLNLAQIEHKRNEKLFNKGGVSQKDLDKTTTNLKTMESNHKSAQEQVSEATASLQLAYANKKSTIRSLNIAKSKAKGADTVKEQIAMSNSANKIAIAQIKQLRAAAKQAELNLSYTKIYAPHSGYITSKNIEDGVYVKTGQPLLAIVPQKRWIVANFKETQLTHMKIGQPVTIKVDSYPDKKFKGRIDSFQASTGAKTSLFPPENAVGSFVKVVQRVPVKITFDKKDYLKLNIVPGMSVIPEVKVR